MCDTGLTAEPPSHRGKIVSGERDSVLELVALTGQGDVCLVPEGLAIPVWSRGEKHIEVHEVSRLKHGPQRLLRVANIGIWPLFLTAAPQVRHKKVHGASANEHAQYARALLSRLALLSICRSSRSYGCFSHGQRAARDTTC